MIRPGPRGTAQRTHGRTHNQTIERKGQRDGAVVQIREPGACNGGDRVTVKLAAGPDPGPNGSYPPLPAPCGLVSPHVLDEDESATRPEDPVHFSEGTVRVGYRAENQEGGDSVKGAVVKGQSFGRRGPQIHLKSQTVRSVGCAAPHVGIWLHGCDTDHSSGTLGSLPVREGGPRSDANLKHTSVGGGDQPSAFGADDPPVAVARDEIVAGGENRMPFIMRLPHG